MNKATIPLYVLLSFAPVIRAMEPAPKMSLDASREADENTSLTISMSHKDQKYIQGAVEETIVSQDISKIQELIRTIENDKKLINHPQSVKWLNKQISRLKLALEAIHQRDQLSQTIVDEKALRNALASVQTKKQTLTKKAEQKEKTLLDTDAEIAKLEEQLKAKREERADIEQSLNKVKATLAEATDKTSEASASSSSQKSASSANCVIL